MSITLSTPFYKHALLEVLPLICTVLSHQRPYICILSYTEPKWDYDYNSAFITADNPDFTVNSFTKYDHQRCQTVKTQLLFEVEEINFSKIMTENTRKQLTFF